MKLLSIPKKILLPRLFIVKLVLAMALRIEGLIMLLTIPVGLIFIFIFQLTGVQITSIWADLAISLVLLFLIGSLIDLLLRNIRQQS